MEETYERTKLRQTSREFLTQSLTALLMVKEMSDKLVDQDEEK